jgi:hypothetical protein
MCLKIMSKNEKESFKKGLERNLKEIRERIEKLKN